MRHRRAMTRGNFTPVMMRHWTAFTAALYIGLFNDKVTSVARSTQRCSC